VFWLDVPHKPIWLDPQPGTGYADPIGPDTLAEGIDPGLGYGSPVQAGGVAPFALATPHQAPAPTVAVLQGYQPQIFKVVADGSGTISDYTGVTYDAHITGIADYHHPKVRLDPSY